MSIPAFQLSGQSAESLPTYHLGSDDLEKTYRKKAGEIVHFRMGVPVSVRTWTTIDRWRVNFAAITEAQVAMLQDYFEARTFDLLPTGAPESSIPVRWVDSEFAPKYVKPGIYALSFEIEEMP